MCIGKTTIIFRLRGGAAGMPLWEAGFAAALAAGDASEEEVEEQSFFVQN